MLIVVGRISWSQAATLLAKVSGARMRQLLLAKTVGSHVLKGKTACTSMVID
jgi:hypothetical protein